MAARHRLPASKYFYWDAEETGSSDTPKPGAREGRPPLQTPVHVQEQGGRHLIDTGGGIPAPMVPS